MRLTKLFKRFFNSEKSAGILLLCCTMLSLGTANGIFGEGYINFWETSFKGHTITEWINDGLMTIFFLMIGLELERELYDGELSKPKDALLPALAALGGVLVPAGIYMLFNHGTQAQSGAGIPMATDIAFAMAVLYLLGSKVPPSLKVFLTALAVIDDILAILVIGVFYSKNIDVTSLLLSLGVFVVLLAFNRLKVRNLIPYLIGGVAMWYFMMQSGIHATISGVMLAFAIPFGNGDEKSTSFILQDFLHLPVAFGILPIFALANTAFEITGSLGSLWEHHYSKGILLGLVVGKPLGVLFFSFIAVNLGLGSLHPSLGWKHLLGVGLLAGIGFTMSIFITILAFDDIVFINNAKLAIILASLVAGVSGYSFLRFFTPDFVEAGEEE